ncbi:MAG: DUF1304 domain-containing protein [Granulosicoccus sp.]
MSVIAKLFAGLSGVIHCLFFLMESVFWKNPAVHGVFKVGSLADAEVIDVFIKNQGFYNLFLAGGIFAGLALVSRYQTVGITLISYVCLYMAGASVVLLFTQPAMVKGVLIQGVPPLIALAALYVSRISIRTQEQG